MHSVEMYPFDHDCKVCLLLGSADPFLCFIIRMDSNIVLPVVMFLVSLLLLLVWIYKRPTKEGFGLFDTRSSNEPEYVQKSRAKYNRFSDATDSTKKNFIHSNDPGNIAKATQLMKDSMISLDPLPSSYANTLLGLDIQESDSEIAPVNEVFLKAEKCEALKTRASCKALDDPANANCGICIKGGTPSTFDNPNKHIGGMLSLPDDREDSLASGVPYEPSIGSCPTGYFFVDRESCERAVNRQDCKEAGESGGFQGGKTIEGIDVIGNKCAQVPKKAEDYFIYEPKHRTFNLGLRVLTPTGTGFCLVTVTDVNGKQIGTGQTLVPGIEFIVPVRNVKEYDKLTISIVLDQPYRKKGNSEIFGYSPYNFQVTSKSASDICQSVGAVAANGDLFRKAASLGMHSSEFGVGLGFFGKALQTRGPEVEDYPIEQYNTRSGVYVKHVWCYGVKPPPKGKKDTIKHALFSNSKILPWFKSFDASQSDQWSEFGISYQAPFERGVLLQWEMLDGNANRTIPFEPTITQINRYGPSTDSKGNVSFKNLRRFGSFKNSSEFLSPRPIATSKMLTNQYWIWSNQATDKEVLFEAQVPGIFADTYYQEDRLMGSLGPLVGNPDTAKLLATSPCMKPGQLPGQYGLECLQNLFVGSGGDITNGKLVTTNGGLNQLNAYGDMDEISGYLLKLYSLATTGRDDNGDKASSTIVNDASQKMFGFDIATPCEDITEDDLGNILLTPKTGAVDSDCLDWLWMNTGTDKSRSEGDGTKNIKHTYHSIGDRFSGLMQGEGSSDLRQQYPFQTCQRTGTMAPVSKKGYVNKTAVSMANTKGGIQGVQDFYNSIFKMANDPASADNESKQAEAIQQCYGIQKAAVAPPASPTPKRIISPGYGYWEGWGDQSILNAWADGPNVGGGLRSKLMTGDKVVLKITSLSIDTFPEKKNNPNYTPPQDKVYYLKFDADTNQGLFVSLDEYDDAACIHTLVFAEDNTQFQTFANQNNMGIQARRNMFALMNNNGLFLTISNRVSTYASGTWPNNQPGPTQMFNWNDFSGFGKPRYPFGPYCPGAWGVLVRGEDGYISLYGNYGVQQLMEVLAM